MLLPIINSLKKGIQHTSLSYLRSQRGGGGVVLVLIMMVVGFISMVAIIKNLEVSRGLVYRNVQLETRKLTVQRIKNLLSSDYIFDYSINNFNKPADNTRLRDCIMAGNPSLGNVCTDIPVSFHALINTTTDEKFLGSIDDPSFLTQFGDSCDPNQIACAFRASSKCTFTCPADQITCATVKIMSCDLEVAPVGGQVFRTLLMSKERSDFVTEVSLQIVPTLDRYTIFRM